MIGDQRAAVEHLLPVRHVPEEIAVFDRFGEAKRHHRQHHCRQRHNHATPMAAHNGRLCLGNSQPSQPA